MKRWVKWLIGVGSGIVFLAAVVFLLVLWFIRRPFPEHRGTHPVSGISAPVEILRDEHGVPHIWGQSATDVYFAQGYVHAQDRFWQMEFSRRIGAGRLSELLGEAGLSNDRFLRTMGFSEVSTQEYVQMPAEHQRLIEAYAAGVNAYIASRPPQKLGLEFALLQLTGVEVAIEPWTPVQSLTWGKVMGLSLGANYATELQNLSLARSGGEALRDLVNGEYRADMPYIISDEELDAYRAQIGLPPLAAAERGEGEYSITTGAGGIGSNNWVIGGELTASGSPIVANDMHLGVQMPSIWYEVGLHVEPPAGSAEEPMHVRGYSFPGVPGAVVGQNESIAWAVTNLGGDVQDLVIEQIDPNDPDRYLRNGESLAVRERIEVIHVSGRDRPVLHRVRSTAAGPILTDLEIYAEHGAYRISQEPIPGAEFTELALNWTALSPKFTVSAIFGLNRAENYQEFREALESWDAPGQNFVMGAADGTIAYQATGSHPDRSVLQGSLPTATVNAPGGQRPIVPFAELPAVVNPAKGFIVTANNPIVPERFPEPLGRDFANGRRARRITDLINQAGEQISLDDVARIQGDLYSINASEVVPFLLDVDLEAAYDRWLALQLFSPGVTARRVTEDDSEREERESQARDQRSEDRERDIEYLRSAVDLLAEWDYMADAEAPGPLAFNYIWTRLLEETLADEAPAGRWPLSSPLGLQDAIYLLLREPSHPVWDDHATADTVETRDEILERSVARGLLELREEHGDVPESWKWGEQHTIEFRNQALGESGIGVIERIFNRGPYPAHGDDATVNVAHWSLAAPFEVTSTVSQRAIYDLSQPDNSRFVHTTGQSGHPYHRNYIDMYSDWTDVHYHASNFSYEAAVEAAGRRRLLLDPER